MHIINLESDVQHLRLLVCQQRRPLAIFIDNLSTWERIASKQSRYADSQRKKEQQTANCESEDPLELEEMRFRQELADAGG